MGGGAWWATIRAVTESGTTERLSTSKEMPALTPVTDGSRVMGFPRPPPVKACVCLCTRVCACTRVY